MKYLKDQSVQHVREFRFCDVNRWRGVLIKQHPCDLIALQMFLYSMRPEAIVECGTKAGGSALFFHDMMGMWTDRPSVTTIDVSRISDITLPKEMDHRANVLPDGVTAMIGDSGNPAVATEVLVRLHADGRRKIFVFLDSDHTKRHVARELSVWSKVLEHPGSFLLCGDTVISDYVGGANAGPRPALDDFLKTHPQYERYPWTPFGISWFYDGMIRRRQG